MYALSDDAKTILLLCGRFGGRSETEPLDQRDYNQVVRWLVEHKLRPADLMAPEHAPVLARETGIPVARLTALLNRGAKLGFAVEKWGQSGIWVICRSDPDYPCRYKTHLKDKAPPILYGAGDKSLLKCGGLAIVGSRNVDEAGEMFTRDVASWCARGGMPVVSGGARGVDQCAMSSALEAGGVVLGVLADSLLRKSVSREARHALSDGRLLLLSPVNPEAGFHVGTAMGRNKLIYALADFGLVVSAEYRKGGTWAGAAEELKRSPARPVFVRIEGAVPAGNRKLTALGALAFPGMDQIALPESVLAQAVASKPERVVEDRATSAELPLFDTIPLEKRQPALVREPPAKPAPQTQTDTTTKQKLDRFTPPAFMRRSCR